MNVPIRLPDPAKTIAKAHAQFRGAPTLDALDTAVDQMNQAAAYALEAPVRTLGERQTRERAEEWVRDRVRLVAAAHRDIVSRDAYRSKREPVKPYKRKPK